MATNYVSTNWFEEERDIIWAEEDDENINLENFTVAESHYPNLDKRYLTVKVNADYHAGRNSCRELENPDLLVTIVDAVIENDVFTFTVQTKNSLPEFVKQEYNVNREHKDFLWLYDQLQANKSYEAIMIPDAPATLSLETSGETKDILERLSDTEEDVGQEDFMTISKNIEEEYLQIFKKAVADHQLFLRRLAAHPILRRDINFKCFIEYEENLSVRPNKTKDQAKKLMRSLSRTMDDVLVAAGKSEDQQDIFYRDRTFLLDLHPALRDAQDKAANMVRSHKDVAESYVTLCREFENLRNWEHEQTIIDQLRNENTDFVPNRVDFSKPTAIDEIVNYMQNVKRCERISSSDMDLKLLEMLRYYNGEAAAAKQLLYRRIRALQNQETCARNLEKARSKNRGIVEAESSWKNSTDRVTTMSESAAEEVSAFQVRRAEILKMRLIDLAELQIKHAKTNHHIIQDALQSIQDI
ncbi:unnamed protein product [Meganyctiphanes norvegica]|uniref:PX domain-containing protein n=2 Tax=Meganyctiphanes norvegica TaxID=48144 RepID=A0AAV2S6W2_MEGNR